MNIKPPKEQIEIEKAIIMLIDCVKKGCSNDKPLILHSLRVGFKLQELKQLKEVVIAGILHDLVEDTNCTINQIKEKFGDKVANLVSACTLPDIKNDKTRWLTFLEQIKKAGKEATIIKIIDANDNLPYTALVKNKDYLKRILWKHQILIEKLKPEIGNLKIFRKYCKKYEQIIKKLKIW